jgi:hypothetical protein
MQNFLRIGLTAFVIGLPSCGGTVSVETGGSAGQGGSAGAGQGGSAGAPAVTSASSTGATSSGGSGGGGAGGVAGAAGSCPAIVETVCVNQVYDCGDTLDNDGDGLTDWQDPDCLGACDNTEDSYHHGIPGSQPPKCLIDCFFDSDSGNGSDECFWSHRCDPLEQTPPGNPEPSSVCMYDPAENIPGTNATCEEVAAQQNDVCLSTCGPATPNGCDCFGCCEMPAGSGKYAWMGSKDEATGDPTCSSVVADDPTLCRPCTPVMGCLNPCAPCELCIGKTTLPPECAGPDGTLQQECPEGILPCGFDCQVACPGGTYCLTGCCMPTFPG